MDSDTVVLPETEPSVQGDRSVGHSSSMTSKLIDSTACVRRTVPGQPAGPMGRFDRGCSRAGPTQRRPHGASSRSTPGPSLRPVMLDFIRRWPEPPHRRRAAGRVMPEPVAWGSRCASNELCGCSKVLCCSSSFSEHFLSRSCQTPCRLSVGSLSCFSRLSSRPSDSYLFDAAGMIAAGGISGPRPHDSGRFIRPNTRASAREGEDAPPVATERPNGRRTR